MNTVGIRAAMFFIQPCLQAFGFVLVCLWLAMFMLCNLLLEACDAPQRRSAES